MHLNTLYGYFGRKLDLIETKNILTSDLPLYLATSIVNNIITINDKITAILMETNINEKLIKDLNIEFESQFENRFRSIKSNVAIASAVTAYARIHMIDYKLLPGTVYTDTDSIFISNPLPDHMIGPELGLMKDELNGKIITQGYLK
jgi:hypothetical protein